MAKRRSVSRKPLTDAELAELKRIDRFATRSDLTELRKALPGARPNALGIDIVAVIGDSARNLRFIEDEARKVLADPAAKPRMQLEYERLLRRAMRQRFDLYESAGMIRG